MIKGRMGSVSFPEDSIVVESYGSKFKFPCDARTLGQMLSVLRGMEIKERIMNNNGDVLVFHNGLSNGFLFDIEGRDGVGCSFFMDKYEARTLQVAVEFAIGREALK